MVKDKIRLCYIISSLCNEGPVNVMYNTVQYADFDRFDISIITLVPEKGNSIFDQFERLPIEIYEINKNGNLSIFNLFKTLKKQIRCINPDMLHAHCPRSLYLISFLSRKYKTIYTIHIYPGLQQKILYGKMKGQFVIWLNHYFTRKCDLPIACAESVSEQYRTDKGWDIVSVPNGASLDVWNYNSDEKKKLKEELGLDQNLVYFIYIGRFSKEKNPDKLVELFEKIDNNKIGLIMLGQGEMWNELNQKYLPNVIMPGFTRRVYDYLKASDYYISASDVEGLANTILENMTVGLPMILSDIPSHREILDNFTTGEVGIIVNHHDLNSLKDGIDHLLSVETDVIRKKIQSQFLSKYTARHMSELYQVEYSKLYNSFKA